MNSAGTSTAESGSLNSSTAMVRATVVFLSMMGLVVAWFWFSMSGIDYRAGDSPLSSFTTAGWFLLGSPFMLAMAAGSSYLAVYLSRKSILFGVAAIALFTVLLMLTINSQLPQNRIARIVGGDAAQLATIVRLREHDSFNDGSTTSGVLSGPPELLELVVAHRELAEVNGAPLQSWFRGFDEAEFPELGTAWSDDYSSFYYDAKAHNLYFVHHIGGRD